jgi:hypothetical protein
MGNDTPALALSGKVTILEPEPTASPYVLDGWRKFQTELLSVYTHPTYQDMTEIRGRVDDFTMGVGCSHEFALVRSGQHHTYQCTNCWHYEPKWVRKVDLTPEAIEAALPIRHHDYTADQIIRVQILQPFVELAGLNGEPDTTTMDYYQYLSTPEWRSIRQRVIRRAGGVCEGCGEREATIVHHLTYQRRGKEFLLDLIAVCRECHDLIHKKGDHGRS